MSQLYFLYVAEEKDARDICKKRQKTNDRVNVPSFDESKQLSLLSLVEEIDEFDEGYTYYEYFDLLYPSEMGAECFVTKFPDNLVRALSQINDESISVLANDWMTKEPSFSKSKWTKDSVEVLLRKVCSTCRNAIASGKSVLFRFSL